MDAVEHAKNRKSLLTENTSGDFFKTALSINHYRLNSKSTNSLESISASSVERLKEEHEFVQMVKNRQRIYELRLPLSKKRKKIKNFKSMKSLQFKITEDTLATEPNINDHVKA